MFERKNDLLIDIGNTRTKYLWCDNANQLGDLQVLESWNHAESLLKQSASVTVASVNDNKLVKRLFVLANELQVPFQEINTTQTVNDIQCPYLQPEKLGVDRWLCGVAIAHQQLHGAISPAVAVIDVGTAANCEFIILGEYKGGWIAPGFELMRRALVAGTTMVNADNQLPEKVGIGTDTEECVNAGCLAMISGLAHSARAQLLQQTDVTADMVEIILTGGTAIALKKQMMAENMTLRVMPDLVFQGMRLFLQQTNFSG